MGIGRSKESDCTPMVSLQEGVVTTVSKEGIVQTLKIASRLLGILKCNDHGMIASYRTDIAKLPRSC